MDTATTSLLSLTSSWPGCNAGHIPVVPFPPILVFGTLKLDIACADVSFYISGKPISEKSHYNQQNLCSKLLVDYWQQVWRVFLMFLELSFIFLVFLQGLSYVRCLFKCFLNKLLHLKVESGMAQKV